MRDVVLRGICADAFGLAARRGEGCPDTPAARRRIETELNWVLAQAHGAGALREQIRVRLRDGPGRPRFEFLAGDDEVALTLDLTPGKP